MFDPRPTNFCSFLTSETPTSNSPYLMSVLTETNSGHRSGPVDASSHLQTGGQKASCAPPAIPSLEVGTGGRPESQSPKKGTCRGPDRVQTIGDLQLPPAGPSVESGGSNQMGGLQTKLRAQGLGSGWNPLLVLADQPRTGKPMRSGA